MTSRLQSKKSTAFRLSVLALHRSTGAALTGDAADFVATWYLDGAADGVVSEGITELADGVYTLTVNSGFATAGLYTLVLTLDDMDTQVFDIEVIDHILEDVYDDLVAGTPGSSATTITVENEDEEALVGASVSIYDSSNETFITRGTSDSSGEVELSLSDGDYKVRLYKAGVVFSVEDLTVSGTTTETFTGTEESISAPSNPDLCVLYADFVDIGGSALEGFVVKIENLFDPDGDLSVVESSSEEESDENGHIEFSAVQGLRLRVSFAGTSITREFEVPSSTTANLLTLIGSATDPYQVVS